MTKHDERAQGAGAAEEAQPEEVRRRAQRVILESIVAAIPEQGESQPGGGAGEGATGATYQPRTRVIAEAVVAAIPAKAEAGPGGGTDDEAGAGE